SETVPIERANFQWLFHRNFRNGQIYARVFVPQTGLRGKAAWFLKRSFYAFSGALGVVVLWPFGAHWSIRAIFAMARNLGQLSFLTSPSDQDGRNKPPADNDAEKRSASRCQLFH